jgi:hypothetical protein
MKADVRHSSAMLRRNLRHIRGWLEEQGAAAEYVNSDDVYGKQAVSVGPLTY